MNENFVASIIMRGNFAICNGCLMSMQFIYWKSLILIEYFLHFYKEFRIELKITWMCSS